jgi:hypothetical protein
MHLGAAATGDLTLLLTAIQVTSKFIATNVRKARLINLYVILAALIRSYQLIAISALVLRVRPMFKAKIKRN